MNTSKHNFPGTPKTLALVMITLMSCPIVQAADDGWYAGASVGQSREHVDFGKVFDATLPPTLARTSYDDGENDVGYKFFGGYQLNRNFALEAGYFDLGDFHYQASTIPAGNAFGKYEADGWNIDAVGIMPLSPRLDLLGRLGVNYGRTVSILKGSGAVPATSPTLNDRATNYKYGFGLQYAMSEQLGLRVEAERFRLDDTIQSKGNVDMFSLGLVYRFGPKAVVHEATPPTPVAATPPPTPVAAPPPAPTKIVFSADSMFDFDSTVVKPAGKQELDKLVADLNGVNYDVITVTGHTDRIGPRTYNLTLSLRRAEAVKAYLVQNGKLPASKITARGINGDEPVTGPNDCRNTASKANQIQCLQVDRRVEVEVTATK